MLQIVSGRDLNGALTYCQFLSDRLTRGGHHVAIACRRDCWLRGHAPAGVTFVESDLKRRYDEVQRIASWIRDQRIDVIHTHMSRAHVFGVLLRMFSRVPVVATAHSCNFQPHWWFNDYVIANSRSTLRYHRLVNLVRAQAERVGLLLHGSEPVSGSRRASQASGPRGSAGGIR